MRRRAANPPPAPSPDSRAWEISAPDPRRDLLLAAAVALAVFLPQWHLAGLELLSPDASVYLDVGRNLFSGGGLVTSLNIYQYWTGTTHPFLPYMQPLYPVVCGAIWTLAGLQAVIAANALLLGVNCGLVYVLASRFTDRVTALCGALIMGYFPNMVYSAMFPWTEQLHLLSLLAAILLYANPKTPRAGVGVLLAIGCLIRVAAIYHAAAFLVALFVVQGPRRRALVESAQVLAGFLAIMLGYEMLCVMKYGALYAEYLSAAKTYTIAMLSGGAAYRNVQPVLHIVSPPPFPAGLFFERCLQHGMAFVRALGFTAPFAVIAPFALFGSRRRDPVYTICVVQGVLALGAYASSLAWITQVEVERYSVVPFATLVPAGMATVRRVAAARLGTTETRLRIASATVFAILFYLSAGPYLQFVRHYRDDYQVEARTYVAARDDLYAWIRTHARPDALVASELLRDAFLIGRPMVSMPVHKALDGKNLDDFLAVYHPEWILTSNESLAKFLVAARGYREARTAGLLRLLERAGS